MRRSDAAFQDVYAEIRRVLPAVRKGKGSKEIVLVTLENGDAETELEKTVTQLERGHVRLSVITREAFLSDAVWAVDPPKAPRGTDFTGAENAFIELPWGFRFQWGIANNGVLSGFAMYGPTRLAAATGGKVYLYYPPSGYPHHCRPHRQSSCLFCEEDHTPEDEVYQSQRLRAVAPPTTARSALIREAASDPFYRAVLFAWEQASRGGLVYSRPSLERMGGSVQIDPYPYRGWTPLGSTISFTSEAARARKLIRECEEILATLDTDLQDACREGGSERYRAVADTTRLSFLVTRMNLLLYVAWCEDVGPTLVRKRLGRLPPAGGPSPRRRRPLPLDRLLEPQPLPWRGALPLDSTAGRGEDPSRPDRARARLARVREAVATHAVRGLRPQALPGILLPRPESELPPAGAAARPRHGHRRTHDAPGAAGPARAPRERHLHGAG